MAAHHQHPTQGRFMESVLLDAAGHRRSPATMPGYHRGRPPRNKGEEYPADPPTIKEIVAVMRAISDRADGPRLRALVVLLWRAGLRITEALALQESELDRSRGAVLVRRGKGGQATRSRDGPLGQHRHGRPSPTISASAGLRMRR
jgi:integrase